jgi:hypothetical protein
MSRIKTRASEIVKIFCSFAGLITALRRGHRIYSRQDGRARAHPMLKTSLTITGFLFILPTRAEVVELVDALRSGRSGSNPVGVRVPPPAPFFEISSQKTNPKQDPNSK